MKKNTPEQQLKLLCSLIIRERAAWTFINENGCNDPFWPDGCNLNLTRNHIISYKRAIAELCEKTGMTLPEEYFLKVPSEVDDNYMKSIPDFSGRYYTTKGDCPICGAEGLYRSSLYCNKCGQKLDWGEE